MNYSLIFIICLFIVLQGNKSTARGQLTDWDSLEQSSLRFPADTNTIISLNQLFNYYSSNGGKQAMPFIERALHLSDSLSWTKGLFLSTFNLATFQEMKGNFYKAFKRYNEALRLAEETANKDYLSRCLLKMGRFYSKQGDIEKAIEYTLRSALLEQESKGVNGQQAYAWLNLGNFYLQNQQLDSARYYSLKSYEIFKSGQDSSGLGDVFFNLGNLTWEAEGNPAKALDYYLQAQESYKGSSVGNIETQLECQAKIGFLYTKLKDFSMAGYYLDKAQERAEKHNLRHIIKKCYSYKSGMHEDAGDYRQAYEYLRRFLALHDSLYYRQSAMTLKHLQNEYELEAQHAKIALLHKDKEVRQDELNRQLLIRNSFVVMVGMLLVLAAVLFRNNHHKQRNNRLLLKQKNEIEEKNKAIVRKNNMLQEQKRAMLMQSRNLHGANQQIVRQKEIIEQKNKDVTDSLHYARGIQYALLPETDRLRETFSDAFVWLQPKDIVSGDFFWLDEQDGLLFIAAVDCTGHGVPGAFMSLIGDRFLKQIVRVEREYQPDRILCRLSELVSEVMKQDTSDNQDGMEMSVCVVNRLKNELYFAGARNHLVYVQDGQLNKIKGDRRQIGGGEIRSEVDFSRHTVCVKKPTKFYLYSDGIRDQFGGPRDKKFGEKQLINLLLEICHHPMDRQRMLIQSRVEEWMEGYEQVDDMLILGWSMA